MSTVDLVTHFFRAKDPWRYRLRFLRYHWRCVLADLAARDPEGVFVDFEVHMVRYKRNGH